MLFALGLSGRIVGDTTYCNYPKAALTLPKIGDINVNYERVIALHPDLIVVDSIGNRSAIARLKELKLPVFLISPTTYANTERSIMMLGLATGTSHKARALCAVMEAKRARALMIAHADRARNPRVFFVVDVSPLWTAGAGTYIDDLIHIAGGVNIAANIAGYAQYSKESLVAKQPDFIIASHRASVILHVDQFYQSLKASRSKHLASVSNDDTVMRPGPRLGDGLLEVARLIHPAVRK